jgi:hypothetical protein
MRISKKLYTTLIITVLTVSAIMAAVPLASAAIGIPTFVSGFPPAAITHGTCYTTGDVEGTGATNFGKVEVYWDNLGTKIAEGYADGTGAFDIDAAIPEDVAGPHNIIVFDVLASETNFMSFTIDPFLVPMATAALPGDSVMLMASGFGDELDTQLYLGAITNIPAESVTLSGTPDSGTLTTTPVVILSVALTVDVSITCTTVGAATGTGTVTVTDDGEGNLEGTATDIAVTDGTNPGEVDVTVEGSINYVTGVITLTATGVDSAGANPATGIVVTIDTPCAADYDYAEYRVTSAGGVETSELGSFMATITVPAIAEVNYGDYDIVAIDTAGNTYTYVGIPMYLMAAFRVDYYITLTPAAGPTGITTTISGRIESNEAYEIRFNTATIASGTSGSDGSYTATYTIPAILSPNPYDVTVVWQVTKTKTAVFTVNPPPTLPKILPPAGQAGDVIVVSGAGFSGSADISLYLGDTLVNSTADDANFGPTSMFGAFTDLEFVVPAITPGIYVIRVVDEYGASTGSAYTFTVTPAPVTTVALNAVSYYQGDRISFNIFTTENNLGTITVTINDPTGATWWTTNTWTLTGAVMKRVLYQDQLFNANPAVLPADAPLGNWNWTVTYTPASTGTATTATGLVAVAAPPTMQTITDLLMELGANITEMKGEVATIETTVGEIDIALADLDATITGFDGDMATIQTSLGTVQTTVSSLNADITTIKNSVNGVTTAVSSLDAVLGVVAGDTAYIKSSLVDLNGTVTDVSDGVATIETDLGTLKVDVASIKTDVASVQTDVEESLPVSVDMMPVWIAVVLSLIAAIAAIFAVVTIRQKIAG